MSGDILRGLIQAAGIPPLCIASSFTKCMNTTWCAHDVRRGLNGSGGVVIFPLNGSPRRQDFHPYHDAMRLWWLLEYAFVAHKLRLGVYRGESWPWKVVGPMGQALLSALDEHGVRPLPKGGCPGCTELRLDNWTISPWGDDSKLFLSWPGATSAVWHKMQHECRNISTHYGRASPSSLWWEAPRGSSDARAADQVIHQAPTHRIAVNGHADSPEERQASERRVVLLDRSPPRQLISRGAVRWPLLRDQVSTNDTCHTAQQWSLPAYAYVTPHGAQLNNRFLMTQQPLPCLVEIFPRGYYTSCYVLPFSPQRHVQVMGQRVWDAHATVGSPHALQSGWVTTNYSKCDHLGEMNDGSRAQKFCQARVRSALRAQPVEIDNTTLDAALVLCAHAVVPTSCQA